MNIALFESQAEADGFRELLRDVVAVDAVVVPTRDGFAVDVLRPADFIGGVVYVLYYVKGLALEELPARSLDERVELLREHLIAYADGERTWSPPPAGLRWYGERAKLPDDVVEAAVADAERIYRTEHRRGGLLARLFSRGPQKA